MGIGGNVLPVKLKTRQQCMTTSTRLGLAGGSTQSVSQCFAYVQQSIINCMNEKGQGIFAASCHEQQEEERFNDPLLMLLHAGLLCLMLNCYTEVQV